MENYFLDFFNVSINEFVRDNSIILQEKEIIFIAGFQTLSYLYSFQIGLIIFLHILFIVSPHLKPSSNSSASGESVNIPSQDTK